MIDGSWVTSLVREKNRHRDDDAGRRLDERVMLVQGAQGVGRDPRRLLLAEHLQLVRDSVAEDGVHRSGPVRAGLHVPVRRAPDEERCLFHRVEQHAAGDELVMHLLEPRRQVAAQIRTRLPLVEAGGRGSDPDVMREAESMGSTHERGDDAVVSDSRILNRRPVLASAVEAHCSGADGRVAGTGLRPERGAGPHTDESPGAGVRSLRQHDPRRGAPHPGRDD